MTCEQVRPLLPELAEGGPRTAGPVEVHLASCPACSRELARYRSLILGLGGLRESDLEPPEALLARLLVELPAQLGLGRHGFVRRASSQERLQHGALFLGGAVVGVNVVGLLWWRAARRTMAPTS